MRGSLLQRLAMDGTTLVGNPAPAAEVAAGAAFLDALFPAPRGFDVRLWDGTRLPAGRDASVTLVVNTPGALRRMFRLPLALRLGEAYLRGDFDLEGDVWAAAPGMDAYLGALDRPGRALRLLRLWRALPRDHDAGGTPAPARLGAAPGSRGWDLAGIRYHYDAGNDFYRLFLGERMVYSCAYFRDGTEDLDAAQEAKLELICRKLRLRPDERLLDVGCGWGGLVIYAAQRFGVRAVGVTLSPSQQALAVERVARAGLQDRVEIRLLDYRDLRDEAFDKIASVGMFEHVGGPRLPGYFAHLYSLLRPGGLLLNHGIGGRGSLRRPVRRFLVEALVGSSRFRRRYIFPTGELVSVSEANLAAERVGFEVRDVENLREHYARTLQFWVRNLEANEGAAIAVAGAPTYRRQRIYMGVASWQFAVGDLTVNQTLLARKDGGRASVPLTRADLYA